VAFDFQEEERRSVNASNDFSLDLLFATQIPPSPSLLFVIRYPKRHAIFALLIIKV
jgi:hypothetical protein